MNRKEKIGYMFIGCLFTIVGYILASPGGMTTNAQDEKKISVDQIVCKDLLVVGKQGKIGVSIGTHENGSGIIEVYNESRKTAAQIHVDPEDGGLIMVYDNAGKASARIRASEDGGGIEVYNKAEKTVAIIGVPQW